MIPFRFVSPWRAVIKKPIELVAMALFLLRFPGPAFGLEVKDATGTSLFSYGGSYALVIWAGDYQNPFWKKLNNIRTEASAVVNALKGQGFQVSVVANPTAATLRQSLELFIQRYGFLPDSRLVIYFAGHGWTRNNDSGYLVPIDAPDASTVNGDLEFAKLALGMEQIISWSKQMEARHALFIFDSCFSGSVFKARSGSRAPAYLERKMSRPVREFLTAGDANEQVPARSIFTPLLVRGLAGAADINQDGYITGSELGDYLPQAMAEYTRDQNPQYGKIRDPRLDEGDIVFKNPSPVQQLPAAIGMRSSPSLPSPASSSPISPIPAIATPISTPAKPEETQRVMRGRLNTVSGESIVDAASAKRLVRERLPQGAIEHEMRCQVVNVAGTDHYRCLLRYFSGSQSSTSSQQ
jgi:hypothetical protein